MSEVLAKVENLREIVEKQGLSTDIEIDGGIGPDNIGLAAGAGSERFRCRNRHLRCR